MARKKQREIYSTGSVAEVWVDKLDRDGVPVVDTDGKPVKVQARDNKQRPIWRIYITYASEEYVDKAGRLRKRQRRVSKTFHGTLEEARTYRDELASQYKNVDAGQAQLTYSKLYKEWADSDDLDCSAKQRKQYLRLLGYCAPYLDAKPLVEIRTADVSAALAKAAVRPNGRKMAPSTAKKMKTVVKRVFEYAVEEGRLEQCPVVVRRKRRGGSHAATTPQRRALSEEEAARLCARLDESESEAYAAYADKEQRRFDRDSMEPRALARGLSLISCLVAVRLMLATGMRRGEALGMTWGNVDLKKGTVRVSQTLSESMEINSPKTDSGIRSLYIDDHTLAHLKRLKAFQAKALHTITVDGVALSQDDRTPVFCSDAGGWIDPTNCYRWWKAYREEKGFGGLLLHELRHTQITLLRANAIDVEMVKTRVGHSHKSDVTDGYTHEMPANDKPAADVMGRILYNREKAGGTVMSMDRTA